MILRSVARVIGVDAAMALMTAVFLIGNFLRVNAYGFARMESVALLLLTAGIVGTGTILAALFRIKRFYYGALAVLILDMGTGWLGALKDVLLGWGSGPFASWAALGVAAVCLLLLAALREKLVMILLVGLSAATIGGWVADIAAPKELIRISETADARPANLKVGPDRPNVLFLLLDEHAALDVLSQEAGPDDRSFEPLAQSLVDRGFDLYDHAVSDFSATWDSIPSYLNAHVDAGPRHKYLTRKRLERNKLFAHYRSLGYRIEVVQSTHMDYCHTPGAEADRCFTYEASSMGYLQNTELDMIQRLRVLSGAWLGLQKSRLLKKAAEKIFPEPQLMHLMAGALAGDAAFEQVRKVFVEHPSKTLIFAHLMLPHSSYIYDDQCRVKDPGEWLTTADGTFDSVTGRVNSDVERTAKYHAASAQVVCTHAKLEKLWGWLDRAGRWDETTILLASDHGSRIYRWNPAAQNKGRMECSDFADAYRAFLAVKSAARAGETNVGLRHAAPARSVEVIAESLGIAPVTRSEGLSPEHVLLADEKTGGFLAALYTDCAPEQSY